MKTITSLYGGTIELEFDDAKHVYKFNEKKVLNVTSILGVVGKPALIFWAVNEAISYLEKNLLPDSSYSPDELTLILAGAKRAHMVKKTEAADIGSTVHYWIKKYIAGEIPPRPDSPEANLAIDNFLKWETDHNVKFLVSERPVMSQEHGYVGTLDLLAVVDGELFLGEIKTTSAIHEEFWLQLSAYAEAWMEEHPHDPEQVIKRVGVIRVGRDGSFEIRDSDKWEENFEVFLAVKSLYEWKEKMKKE